MLSKTGKSTDKNKSWLKIKHLDNNSQQSVDFSKIKDWENVGEEIFILRYNNQNLENLQAKSAELENLKAHRDYAEVDDIGQNTISVRLVISKNFNNENFELWKAK